MKNNLLVKRFRPWNGRRLNVVVSASAVHTPVQAAELPILYQILDAPLGVALIALLGLVLAYRERCLTRVKREKSDLELRLLERAAALQVREADLHRAQAVARIGSWKLDLQSGQIQWSDETFRIFGVPNNAPPSLNDFPRHIYRDDTEAVGLAWQNALKLGQLDVEHRIVVNGEVRWVHERAAFIDEESQQHWVGTVQDVTEWKRTNEALHRQSTDLALHNEILQRITAGTDLTELLEELAHRVESQHPGMIVSILLASEDGVYLEHAAAPNLPAFYNEAISGVKVGDGVGSCGTAAYRGELVVVKDIQTHPFWAAYRDVAHQAKLRSCWSHPIKTSTGQILGTFAIYHTRPCEPGKSEISFIQRYAKLAELAIERERNLASLRIAATAFESQEGMLVMDAGMVILRVNRALTRITGFTAADLVGQAAELCCRNSLKEAIASARCTGAWKGELQSYRKNGAAYPARFSVTAVQNDAGATTHYVGTLFDITERKAAEAAIEHYAFYDPLTGLPNRRLLLDRLQQTMKAKARSGHGGALLFIDLDDFKTLNDTRGHSAGDRLLQAVAKRLLECVRDSETVARFGGDEFVILVEDLGENPDQSAVQVAALGERILSAFAEPCVLDGAPYLNTLSIGVALFTGVGDSSVDEVLKQADLALYGAKAAGKHALRFFDPNMEAMLTARIQLEKDLHTGLRQDEFALHYQPQVDIDGRLTGMEALVRWQHPTRGPISPAEFIPVAEEIGLILPLGRWIMEAACAQLVAWTGRGAPRLTMSVNVSIRQFRQPNFVEQVLAAIHSAGVDPRGLKLELTESLLADDMEDTISKMNALKKSGVSFSLDDFGTGYSCLTYLKRLPLDQLKIDQSFVRHLLEDPNDAAIVRTIVALTETLGLEVIAEGVECEAQREFLKNQGCLAYQGYLFGRPLSAAEFERAWHSELMPSTGLIPREQ